jgi:hypothetical protein
MASSSNEAQEQAAVTPLTAEQMQQLISSFITRQEEEMRAILATSNINIAEEVRLASRPNFTFVPVPLNITLPSLDDQIYRSVGSSPIPFFNAAPHNTSTPDAPAPDEDNSSQGNTTFSGHPPTAPAA